MLRRSLLVSVLAAFPLLMAGPAFAHVTVQPTEAQVESFSHFVVNVPNERDNADTTKVQVKFPKNLLSVSFGDVPGWTRTVKMQKLKKPVELFGSKVTETIGTVTWSGGKIGPGEFMQFPFSARVPEEEEIELTFPAVQTYSNGEVVRWIGPADAEEPAPEVETVDLEAPEGLGELGVLHETVHEVQELSDKVDSLQSQVGKGSGAQAAGDSSDAGGGDLGVILGSIGTGLGAIALLVALFRKRA